MARDRVPVAQERVVALRSGNACAHPDCGVKLVFEASHEADLDKPVGRVAHICAASPGGPRYDKFMTKEQRGAAANLMYLCGEHHDAVDYQLHLHTREYLTEAKVRHERKVARAIQYSIGNVSFKHLEIVCNALAISGSAATDDVLLPLEIDEKINLNDLTSGSRDLILIGLAKVDEVGNFVTSMNAFSLDFGARLAARFKQEYFRGVADGLVGDQLYTYVCGVALDHAGPVHNDEVEAAVLAVVAYLFSLCEIFEHEQTAA